MGFFLQLEQISKSFGPVPAVHNLSLTLDQGQILCLLGPSGCGKTTLLRLIAGLERVDAGHIRLEGHDIAPVPPHQRDFGLMFQDFALFPHKNVGQNVAFGLHLKKQANLKDRIREMLALVGLSGFEERDVSTLSGGERQRVALARSLAPSPRLLMLDEPLGALDRALREHLMLEVRQILKSVGLSAIYVTHDQTEAFAIADRIVVMNQGCIEQDSSPEQLYQHPATPFVAQFLGFANLLEATCLPNGQLETPLGRWSLNNKASYGAMSNPIAEDVMLLIRPEAALLRSTADSIMIEGTVINTTFRGRFYQVLMSVRSRVENRDGFQQLTFELPVVQLPNNGSKMKLWLDPTAIILLPRMTP